MTTHTNDSSRLNGTLEPDTDHVERMSYASLLPEDFPDRLERLKEASGLTWSGLAAAIGVDYKQMYKWRKGTEPSGGALHSLYLFACQIPGGLQILLGDGFQMTFFKN